MSHLVHLDDESYEYLRSIKEMLPKRNNRVASFSDAVKLQKSLNQDVRTKISRIFQDLNSVLRYYYQDDREKVHISELLRAVCLKAVNSSTDDDFKYVYRKLIEILEGE